MFSAIRRHFQSSQPSQATSPRPTPLPQSLQEKFQRGITANMRILICGKKKCGKTSLLNRLKGKPHSIEYNPTKEVVKDCFHFFFDVPMRDHPPVIFAQDCEIFFWKLKRRQQ